MDQAVPTIVIDVRQQYSKEQESAIINAVFSSLATAFGLNEKSRNARLVVHDPHHYQCPPGLEKPQCYTQVSIECIPGRSLEAKRALYQSIVTGLQTLGIPPGHVMIVIREISADNWGIRGGQAACDLL